MAGRSSFARRLAVAMLATALAAAVCASSPARAVSVTILDGNGVDYDATCLWSAPGSPPPPNSVASPGGAGCPGFTSYDGSTESTDLRSVKLESLPNGRLRATLVVDNALPLAGSLLKAVFDGPDSGVIGARVRVMYQNEDKLHWGDNTSSGCAHVLGGRVHDQHGHWLDGYHFFLGYGVMWDGVKWIHDLHVGKYDPAPGGGFRTTKIAENDGAGWTTVDPAMVGRWNVAIAGATVTFEVTGRVLSSNPLCAGGVMTTDYFSTSPGPYSTFPYLGDTVSNVKGLSTVIRTTGPKPGATPCGPDSDDGCVGQSWATPEDELVSDTTAGPSTAGAFNTNITGIAFTKGLDDSKDNDGNEPDCPTPTMHGSLPPNPWWLANQNQPCQTDDDTSPSRGSLWAEFW